MGCERTKILEDQTGYHMLDSSLGGKQPGLGAHEGAELAPNRVGEFDCKQLEEPQRDGAKQYETLVCIPAAIYNGNSV